MTETTPSRLAARLAQTRGLVVICAPPGFGKMRLIEEARGLLANAVTSEMRLSESDFLRDPDSPALAVSEASDASLVTIRQVPSCNFTVLERALRTRASRDDCPRIWVALDHPQQLAYARMLADGQADLIDSRALRPDELEFKQRLSRVPVRFRRLVSELANGWLAAGHFLTRWAQQANPGDADWREEEIVEACGLAAFIKQEVLPLATVDEFQALMRASVVSSTDLGAWSEDGATSRREIVSASRNLSGLVVRNGDKVWIQPAFRAWLRSQFDLLPEMQRSAVLEAAATWLVKDGHLVEGARLLGEAGLADRIGKLIQSKGSLLIWMEHGFSTLRELVEGSPPHVIAQSETLQLMQCIILMKAGQIAEAQSRFAALDAKPATEPVGRLDREIVRATLMVYGCGLQQETDFERFKKLIAKGPHEPGLRSLFATLSCVLNTQRGRFDAARANLVDARAYAKSARSSYNVMFLSLHEANMLLALGEYKLARIALNDARKRWRHEFPEDSGAETVTAALAATLEYEFGHLSAARGSVRRSAYRMPDSEAWFDIYAAAYEPMARTILLDHGLCTALEAIEGHIQKLEPQGLARVAALLQNLMHVLVGEAWLRAPYLQVPALPPIAQINSTSTWQEREMHSLASAFAMMRAGHGDKAEAQLRQSVEAFTQQRLMRSALRAQVAWASLLLKNGQTMAARAALEKSLRLAYEQGAKQVFDHYANDDFLALILQVAEELGSRDASLARFAKGLFVGRDTLNPASSDLSRREQEILAAVAEGGSDKVVGRLLGISEHGVRFHLKHIYKKLDVHDRASAIHKGRLLGAI